MFKKSTLFVVLLGLFTVFGDLSHFADAAVSGGRSGGFSSGARGFSSGVRATAPSSFSSGSRPTTTTQSITSGTRATTTPTTGGGWFSSGSKATTPTPSGITSGARPTEVPVSSAPKDMMSQSIQRENATNAYKASQPAATPSRDYTPPSGDKTIIREKTVIVDRDRGSNMYVPIPIVVGGGHGHDTVIVNNGANPPPVGQTTAWNDGQQTQQESKPWFLKFLLYLIGFCVVITVLYAVLRTRL